MLSNTDKSKIAEYVIAEYFEQMFGLMTEFASPQRVHRAHRLAKEKALKGVRAYKLNC